MNRHQLRNVPKELADEILHPGILQDGERLRVPVSMMDSANPRTVLADGKQLAAHRNGFRIGASQLSDAKKVERERIYQEYDAAIESEYTGFGSAPSMEFRGDQVGDLCTCRNAEFPNDVGSPGHFQERGGRLVCVPDNPKATDAKRRKKTQYRDPQGREEGTAEEDLNDARSIRDRAYRSYESDLVNAWRGPINEQTHDTKPRRPAGKVLHDTTASAYADYDAETANAWRGR